jgi:hypothetical protein
MTKLPEEDVADRVLEEIKAANLIEESYIPKLRELLLSGVSRSEDWRFVIESSIAKQKTRAKAPKAKAGRRAKQS